MAIFLQTAEGIPPQTPLRDVFDIIRYRREQDLIKERRQAETLVKIVKLATDGGVFLDVVSHLYPNSIIEGIKRRKAEAEEEAEQTRRLDQIRAIARRFDNAR